MLRGANLFEANPTKKGVDPAGRKTLIVAVAIAAVVILIPAIILGVLAFRSRGLSSGAGAARLEDAVRSGQPEFEELRRQLFMDEPQATEARRAVGDIVMNLQTTLRNFTGRTVTGVEMRAAVVDLEGNSVRERITIVLPSARTGQREIEPNNTLPVQIMLEGFRQDDVRANIQMEITAIRAR